MSKFSRITKLAFRIVLDHVPLTLWAGEQKFQCILTSRSSGTVLNIYKSPVLIVFCYLNRVLRSCSPRGGPIRTVFINNECINFGGPPDPVNLHQMHKFTFLVIEPHSFLPLRGPVGSGTQARLDTLVGLLRLPT